MDVIASAPGKVFVVGEYAVVSGGPAVVATVSRRLRSRARARRGRGELVIRSQNGPVRCSLATERVGDLPPHARFVAGAALVSARLLDLTGLDVEIETESDLDHGPGKTGLGGSAAATAATVSAMHGLAEHAPAGADGERQRVAAGLYVHRLVQQGGSAADVIAATVGGLVWVDGLDGSDVPRDVSDCVASVRSGVVPTFERLTLPPGLALEVVSSGKSCATAPRVARYAALVDAERPGPAAVLREWIAGMRATAEIFRQACLVGDRGRLLIAVRAAAALLSRLGALTGIPVFTKELRRACALAATIATAAAKPSGAGGGDCAIAIVADEDRVELRERWRAAGLDPLGVELDARGASCEVLR